MSVSINTKINGQSISASADASASLLEFLRDTLEMKGSKLCCNTGECGACTVIYNGKPINSCVTMAADANGAEIITIEGLADGDKLHPVQQAFIDTGAVQCGYCTPGYIMSVKALLDRTKKPTAEDIEEAVSGNICRCTGYNKIVDAIHLAAQKLQRDEPTKRIISRQGAKAKCGMRFLPLRLSSFAGKFPNPVRRPS